MTRRFGRRDPKLLAVISALAVAVLAVPRPLHSGSQSGTTLSIQVQPEVFMEANAALSWVIAGEQMELSIPLEVTIRLNRGTSGELMVYLTNEADPKASSLEVATESGMLPITTTPVVVRRWSVSGIYRDTMMIQRPASAGNNSLPPSLALQIVSTDGAMETSRILVLPTAVAPAQ